MKKRWEIYYLILFLIASAAAAAAFVTLLILPVFVISGVWWALYYHRLSYTLTSDELIIKSGVIFSKLRCIGLTNIQWVMRLKLPFCKTASLSALHTASGIIVIFSDFSTKS